MRLAGLTPLLPYWLRLTSKLIPSFGVKYQQSRLGFVLGVHTSNLSAKLSTRVVRGTRRPEPTVNDIAKMIAEAEGPNTNTNTKKEGNE
jgi:hypothetical protein